MPALLLGLALGRRWPGLSQRLAPPLVQWGVPFSLMGLLLRSGLNRNTALVALLALLAVAGGLLLLRRWLPQPVEQMGAVVGNTAYFGIPAVLALLPAQAVGYAISYDLVATLFTWSLGPLLLAGQPLRLRPLLLIGRRIFVRKFRPFPADATTEGHATSPRGCCCYHPPHQGQPACQPKWDSGPARS